MDEPEIKLALRFGVPKDGLTVNGIFQLLEERAGQALEESVPDGYRKIGH